MTRLLIGFLSGFVFALGLIISGKADLAKVLNFFDVFGACDPSLAFATGGASLAALAGYGLAWRQGRRVLLLDSNIPITSNIPAKLLTGAAVFGTDWGIGGFCPGPARTALTIYGARHAALCADNADWHRAGPLSEILQIRDKERMNHEQCRNCPPFPLYR